MKTAATIISWIFHPLLFATYLVLLLGWYMPQFLLIPVSKILTFAGLVFIMTFILPAANLVMFRAFGTLPSLEMKTQRERFVPFVLIAIIYLVVTLMFYYKVSANVNFNKVMMITTGLIFIAAVATFFEKVSVHSLAVCGAVGILLPLNKVVENGVLFVPTLVMLMVAGLVMSARLYLNAHTPRQVLYGAVLGFSGAFFGMIFLFK